MRCHLKPPVAVPVSFSEEHPELIRVSFVLPIVDAFDFCGNFKGSDNTTREYSPGEKLCINCSFMKHENGDK